jgi:ferredoxin-NADP reductase
MAQNPKTLRVVSSRADGAATRVLTITETSGGDFGEIGGKYIIVHTGLVRADKAIKRAYSLMPGEAGEGRAEIAVKRIGEGAGVLHAAEPGAEFTFSGPWGKLIPEDGLAERTLLVATDTGITSALGVIEQAAQRDRASPLTVLWLTAPDETFLTPFAVRARIEHAGARLSTVMIPEVGDPTRLATALKHVEALAQESSATHVIATGDGAIVHPLKALLPNGVATVQDVRCECFFNNPEKKSA